MRIFFIVLATVIIARGASEGFLPVFWTSLEALSEVIGSVVEAVQRWEFLGSARTESPALPGDSYAPGPGFFPWQLGTAASLKLTFALRFLAPIVLLMLVAAGGSVRDRHAMHRERSISSDATERATPPETRAEKSNPC